MQIAATALNKLLRQKYFSISAVDDLCKLLGGGDGYNGHAYRQLKALHCIDYADMPADVRSAIPTLIRQVIGMSMDLPIAEYALVNDTPTITIESQPSLQ